ncbi:GntR family transcriptional regulator [Roseomonas elaeocarpi]|uniref:GntR family transcriptional regulator n=1 Tax=Roseomonas elaeocarpi TaxID=907779 RepID=A0ABV6JMA2_9PROT
MSLAQRAYDAIFSAIQGGQLKAGSSVREADLTAWLAMSRTPLREALKRLEGEGLLRLQGHRGILISRLDRQATVELFTAREWGEGAAAALAARNATPAEIAGLQHILELERGAADDPLLGARYNRMLHEAIYDCTRNRYLITHLRAMSALLALAGHATRRSAGRVAEAGREHAELVDAIACGDVRRAEEAARSHIGAAQRFVLNNQASAQ